MNEGAVERVRSLAILLYNNLTCQRRWTSDGKIMDYVCRCGVWVGRGGCGHVSPAEVCGWGKFHFAFRPLFRR